MSLNVSHKTKEIEGKLIDKWVVRFFDPNNTNVVVRSEVLSFEDFSDLSRFSLRMFMTQSNYNLYFDSSGGDSVPHPKENECAVYEYSDVRNASPNFSTLETLSQDRISGCMMYHVMSNSADLLDIRGIARSRSFSTLSADVRQEIFFARSSGGVPALYLSME